MPVESSFSVPDANGNIVGLMSPNVLQTLGSMGIVFNVVGQTPTTATLPIGTATFRYMSGIGFAVYVNDNGVMKVLNLGVPL